MTTDGHISSCPVPEPESDEDEPGSQVVSQLTAN